VTEPLLNSFGEPAPPFKWSFSQWETYSKCPQKWKFQSIMKLPRAPSGPAAARGTEMHSRVDQYITRRINSLDPDPNLKFGDKPAAKIDSQYIPMLDEYRDHPNGDVYAEKKLAFDSDWQVCGPKSPFAACVAVLDAARYVKPHATSYGLLHVGEWKSGTPKDSHADQRKLYAMFGMRNWHADEVQVTTYYLEGTAPPARTTVKSAAGFNTLKELWEGRVIMMQKDTILAPKPSLECNWCDYAKKRGGPCQFGS